MKVEFFMSRVDMAKRNAEICGFLVGLSRQDVSVTTQRSSDVRYVLDYSLQAVG